MSDVATPLSSFPGDLHATYPLADLLWGILETSLTGLALYAPLWDAEGRLVDFRINLLNPAAQRILGQPARPSGTYLQYYPHTLATGVFAFHREAYETGEPARLKVNYQGDGLDNYFHLAARRVGQGLLVSFTDTADAARTEVELALRASQTQEQAARATAEYQRNQFQALMDQAPVALGFFEGPELRITAANQQMCTIWGYPASQLLHRPFIEAVPELQGQGFDDLLRQVMATETPVTGTETPAQMLRDGQLTTTYYDFVYKPFYDAAGQVQGVIDVAVEVTAQVVARQQLQALADELLAANQELEKVTQELEVRVQQRTHQAQQQSHRLARLLAEAPAAIATLAGPDLVFEFLNEDYQALFPNRQLLGQPVLEALPELAGSPLDTVLREVYQTGHTFEGREVLIQFARPGDGQVEDRYFNFIYQARYDLSGRIDGLVLFGFEATETVQSRRQREALQAELLAAAQRQVQEREALYQVFAQSPAVVLLLRGPQHRIDYINAAGERLFPGRQLRGRTIAESQPEAAAQGFVQLLDQVYRTGETHLGDEVSLRVLDEQSQLPRTTYLNFSYQAYREQDHIVGVSVFAYDVTEQVLARQQRETQQRQLAEVFAQAPVAICVFQGPTYVLDIVNPSMGEMLGYPPSYLVGQPFFEALPELAHQGLRALLDEVTRTGTPYVAQEQAIHLGRHAAGEVGYFNFVYQPLRDDQARLTAILCVAIEITEQVQVRQQVQDLNEQLTTRNAELHESNTRLTHTNADLDNFIYTASHDLKQPISNIEGLLALLPELLPAPVLTDEVVAPVLHRMQDSVERFKRTISHLTEVSKLQAEFAQRPEPISLAAVIEDMRQDLLTQLTETQARLEVAVQGIQPRVFSAKNLRSIMYNLLSNALKYRHPDRPPVVRITGTPQGNQLRLRVQDNGLGLTEQQQTRLFQLFQRLHTHTEGSGVGLYMVKKIVENVGGTITVQSQLHKGTTFTLVFPA